MSTFILILFFHVGAMGDGNSNATAVVSGFELESECRDAGKASAGMVAGTVKEMRFVCVKQTKSQ